MTINILQLCSGKGSRFANYSTDPKPFINVNGHPMFKASIDTYNSVGARHHYLFQTQHVKTYNPRQYLNIDDHIHCIDYYTDGAATSAEYVIKNSDYIDEPWLIVDCDIMLSFDYNKFLSTSNQNLIFVKEADFNLNYSYSCLDKDFNVLGVAEKQPISKYYNTGQYYWTSGSLFLKYCNYNYMVNKEYYISTVYNYAIREGVDIKGFLLDDCFSIGTPETLNEYLKQT